VSVPMVLAGQAIGRVTVGRAWRGEMDHVRTVPTGRGFDIVITLRCEDDETTEDVNLTLDHLETQVLLDLLAGEIDAFDRFRTYCMVGAQEILRRLAGGQHE